jgi:hypothetical protein
VFDLSLRLQLLQSADLIFSRHLRIDSMQLIKINPVETQPAQAALAGGSQVFRRPVLELLVGTGPTKAALGSNYQAYRIRVKRLRDDFFTHVRTVGVRRIDKVDSQFHGSPQNSDSLSSILRLAPNSFSRESHAPEPQARNLKIISDQEFARLFSRCLAPLHRELLILHILPFRATKLGASNCSVLLE